MQLAYILDGIGGSLERISGSLEIKEGEEFEFGHQEFEDDLDALKTIIENVKPEKPTKAPEHPGAGYTIVGFSKKKKEGEKQS